MIDGLTRVVTGLNRVFLAIAAGVIVILAVFMTFVVVRRYVFNAPLGWALDVSRAMFAYAVFFALGPTLQNANHVSMDLVHERLPSRWQYWATALAWLMVLLFSTLLLWKVGDHSLTSFETGRRFQGSWRVPAKYIDVSAPVGVAQMVFTAIVGALRHVAHREHVPVWPVAERTEEPWRP